MSSEVCPFCGKTFKRLKSHLPHCKAAASSKTPPAKQDISANQTTPPQLAAAWSKTTAKGKKSTQKPSAATDGETERGTTVSLPASHSLNSTLLPSSTKKKKQKLADQIKTDTLFLSASPTLSPAISKPKKKSLRALIEAAKADQVTEASLKGSVSEHSSPSLRRSEQKEIKATQDKDLEASLSHLSVDNKSKDSPKKKVSKMKKDLSTTQHTSNSLKSYANESNEGLSVKHIFRVESERESEDMSISTLFLKSRSADQVKVTLQDVKATLGRANARRQSSRPSILSKIEVADTPSSETKLNTDLSPILHPFVETQKDDVSVLDRLPSTQHEDLQSGQKKSKRSDSILLQEQISASTPLLSAHPSSQVPLGTSLSRTVSSSEVWKVGQHMTGLLSIPPPLHQFSSPLLHPPAAETRPGRLEELQLEVRKQDAADKQNEGPLTRRRLGQVTLRQLPEWLACRTPTHPRDVVEMVQKGWQWYYRRYIDVKKGGVGGVGMLLAGYCVLSYMWSYSHIKLSRWRKYH